MNEELEIALGLIRKTCKDQTRCSLCPLRSPDDPSLCGIQKSCPDQWELASDPKDERFIFQ